MHARIFFPPVKEVNLKSFRENKSSVLRWGFRCTKSLKHFQLDMTWLQGLVVSLRSVDDVTIAGFLPWTERPKTVRKKVWLQTWVRGWLTSSLLKGIDFLHLPCTWHLSQQRNNSSVTTLYSGTKSWGSVLEKRIPRTQQQWRGTPRAVPQQGSG